MPRRKSLIRIKHKRNIALVMFSFVLISFITWFLIKTLTTETNLELITTYQVPEFTSLENLYSLGYGSYAVAVNGEVVGGYEPQELRPTASMAKMILGLAIVREKPLNLGEPGEAIVINEEYYKLYQYYASNGGSTTEVEIGEEISEYDALMSVFLESSNNMADTLAIWAFGSMDAYNDYAKNMLKELELDNIYLGPDASGFDAGTKGTASDLAKLARYVMMDPVLKQVVSTVSYNVPVAGEIENTNKLLGRNNILGVKTGFIGEVSGYCLASSYLEGDNIITLVLMGAPTREKSFIDSLSIIRILQEKMPYKKIASAGEVVGYYDSWWTGKVKIVATEDLYGLGWADAITTSNLEMDGETGFLTIVVGESNYKISVKAEKYDTSPSMADRIRHAFGWSRKNTLDLENSENTPENDNILDETKEALLPITSASSNNCTIGLGALMLINPNFPVEDNFISVRRSELVSIYSLYGIVEGNPGNGDNLLDQEAAEHINEMVKAYENEYPGHTLETRSCFRSVGTKCGRLCAATGESDHHTGLTCDLLDPAYGTELDTDYYIQHIDWQWLKANSYKYGFIDRFPEAWTGGPMSEPANVNEDGTTGLYETWHYRYVGVPAATDIAIGKYNNGEYDSLEHYLKARGLVQDLRAGICK